MSAVRARELDLAYVRAHFPALSDEWALMDNAGGSPPLFGVIEAVHDYMRYRQVNLGASYALSADATARVAAGASAMAQLVGCDPDEVVLGPSSTMLRAASGVGAGSSRPATRSWSRTSITSRTSRPGASSPERGVVVREWRFDVQTGDLTLEALERVLSPRTKLVCFPHVSNLFGTVHDAAAFVRRIHEAGALACVDGVAFAPHRRVDVRAIGADFYFLSLYKLSGPHEGLLYARRDRLRATTSLAFPFLGDDLGPYRLQPGNVNHELTAALPALLEYYVRLGEHHGGDAFEVIETHESQLAQPILDFLAGRKGVRLLGRARMGADRVPTISFTVEGRRSEEIVRALDTHKIGTRFGNFYSYRTVEALGLDPEDGVVRISLFHANTPAEVDAAPRRARPDDLAEVLDQVEVVELELVGVAVGLAVGQQDEAARRARRPSGPEEQPRGSACARRWRDRSGRSAPGPRRCARRGSPRSRTSRPGSCRRASSRGSASASPPSTG